MPILRALAAVSLAALASAQPSMTPCHENKPGQAAPTCETLVIPPNLCRACPLIPALPDGNFASCRQIYDMDAPGCRDALREYVTANPCDTKRATQVEKWDAAAKEGLDYFAYSMCEMCCDTVEKGSTMEEYEDRAVDGTLWSLKRGNGPAHFFYDICTVFPNFKAFDIEKAGCGVVEVPPGRSVCRDMEDWVKGPGKDWFGDNDISASPKIMNAIGDSMVALSCSDKTIWGNCVAMEKLQSRV